MERQGSYLVDPNAFIFKLENNSIEKYPINDKRNAIKISKDKDEDLFIIGRNDIVIKKSENKNESTCNQTSFNYNGLENALIGKKGTFEVKSICVIRTMNLHEDYKQLFL